MIEQHKRIGTGQKFPSPILISRRREGPRRGFKVRFSRRGYHGGHKRRREAGAGRMDENEYGIYGRHLPRMQAVTDALLACVDEAAAAVREKTGMDPVEHVKSRIKTERSMREKCRRLGLPETEESALREIRDAIGLRVVCPFLDDVYAIRDRLAAREDLEIVCEKDYIRRVKPNGYRSLHLIVRKDGYFGELQLRTISMDTWAALEHHIRYKKVPGGDTALLFRELKRCADELASTDVSMQTIRCLLYEEEAVGP